jgi:2-amino-4-hydroxy-6-hydroxymethyldihydropteridine diphosphokinase
MRHVIYLGLGSNIGDRQANLEQTLGLLAEELDILAVSSIYETPPWGYADQPAFYNQAVKAGTCLKPLALLEFIKSTESGMGRIPTFRYGPRCIDVDILFYDDLVMATETLTIPHPQLSERAFVLVPLAEIAPGLVHPISGRTTTVLLGEVDQHGIHRITEAA